MKGHVDRRHFRRFPKKVKVKFRALLGAKKINDMGIDIEEETVLDEAQNALLGNLFVRSNTTYPEGSILELLLTIPEMKKDLHVLSEVIWVSEKQPEKGMGLRVFKTSEQVLTESVLYATPKQWITVKRNKKKALARHPHQSLITFFSILLPISAMLALYFFLRSKSSTPLTLEESYRLSHQGESFTVAYGTELGILAIIFIVFIVFCLSGYLYLQSKKN